MTSIAVERTGFGIVVAEDGDTEAATLLDGLPALRAARYLTATPALRDALRGADAELVDAVRPHLDGAVVVPEAGLADEGDDAGGAESTRLAQALGVSVIAPEGRFIRCEGTLFSVGGDGWVTQSPRGARVRMGRRYPAPAWQPQLPNAVEGAAHIPAGLWITAGTEQRHAKRLAGIAVRHRQLLVVAGSPSEPAPTEQRLLAVLRSLPDETRSAVVLAGFGSGSLPLETVRALAAALGQPLRVAHGVEIDGEPVRIDGDDVAPPTALAVESVCAPDGTVTLERWAPPPGLVAVDATAYRLGETRGSRRRPGDRWVVEVVAAGLVVRPEGPPFVDASDLQAPADSFGIFVRCDDAQRPASLPALIAPLLERLEQRGAVTIHPLDAAARRVVRDAYPGRWAPTEAIAITTDGRIVAATDDASGDTAGHAALDAVAELVGDAEVDAAASVDADPADVAPADAEPADAEPADVAPADVAPADAPVDAVADRTSDGAADAAAAATADEIAEPAEAAQTVVATRRSTGAARRSAARPPLEAAREHDAPSTVDAVIGAETASVPPQESAGAARRRARAAQVTNVQSVDDAAAAWYAAAVPRPAAAAAAEQGSSAGAPPPPSTSTTPAPAATAGPAAPRAHERAAARSAATSATAGLERQAEPARASAGAASDALARALQGSTATRLLGGGSRGTSAPSSPAGGTPALASSEPSDVEGARSVAAAQPAATAPSPETRDATNAAADDLVAEAHVAEAAQAAPLEASGPVRQAIDVPADARSTAEQRHRVRAALGSRYDVASRTVAQLLAQQPGMRVATSDRSAMLTGLSLVRVFATEPHAEYDLDFHTCLAEGLAMLPTARSVVVRGIPAALDADPGTLLRLRAPLVAAATDGPATGPSEALIWTTSGRRLDRVLHGSAGAADIVLPAGTRLRVLGSAEGPVPRLLLAEEGADAEQALARLQSAADARGEVGAHADDRWFGDLPLAA